MRVNEDSEIPRFEKRKSFSRIGIIYRLSFIHDLNNLEKKD